MLYLWFDLWETWVNWSYWAKESEMRKAVAKLQEVIWDESDWLFWKDTLSKLKTFINNLNTSNSEDIDPDILTQQNSIQEYLKDFPKMKEKYKQFREWFLRELEAFSNKTNWTPIDANMDIMLQDYKKNIDTAMMNFFETIWLRENPEVRERLLRNTNVPVIKWWTMGEIGSLGLMKFDSDIDRYVLYIATDWDISYEPLKDLIIHEFLHAYVQSNLKNHGRNKNLNEWVTELLSHMINWTDYEKWGYLYQAKLANLLYLLDKDALLDWYTGWESSKYKKILIEKLSPTLGSKEAERVSSELVNLKNIKSELYIKNVAKYVPMFVEKAKKNWKELNLSQAFDILLMPRKSRERGDKIIDILGENQSTDTFISELLISEHKIIKTADKVYEDYFWDLINKLEMVINPN